MVSGEIGVDERIGGRTGSNVYPVYPECEGRSQAGRIAVSSQDLRSVKSFGGQSTHGFGLVPGRGRRASV